MFILLFFIASFVLIICLQIKLKGVKTSGDILRKYLDEERELNMSPKKAIGEEFFVTPDLERFPLGRVYPWDTDGRASAKESYIIKKSKLPMIKFKEPLANRDLKTEFGIGNLKTVIDYEENFNVFVRALIDWSQMLIENGAHDEAEQALRECIRLGSDYVKNFTLLADIYADTDPDKLNLLSEEIQNSQLLKDNPHVKEKALEYVMRLLANKEGDSK